jgi:uncharacterized protein DUF3800
MYLCYVDESGFSRKGYDNSQPVQVMAGIFPNLYGYHKSDAECKKVFNLINETVPIKEIKARDIYRGGGRWHKETDSTRNRIIEFYLNWLIDRNHKVIISAIDNKKFFDLKDDGPYSEILKVINHPYILGGLHIALVVQSSNRNKNQNKGKTLLIFDEQSRFEDSLAELIYEPPEFVDEFVKFDMKKEETRLNQIIDTAFFVKSHHSTMAQVADVIAYLFRLFLGLNYYGKEEAYDGEKNRINKWIKMIEENLIKKYPKRKSPFIDFLNSTKCNGI